MSEIAVTALEAGFREYASEFFALTLDQQAEVAADTPLVTVKNIPAFTAAEQEKLTEDYIAHLKNDVMRNKIRLDIIPLLKNINPSACENIHKTALRMVEAGKVFDDAIEKHSFRVAEAMLLDTSFIETDTEMYRNRH